jgi:hypothetical protein
MPACYPVLTTATSDVRFPPGYSHLPSRSTVVVPSVSLRSALSCPGLNPAPGRLRRAVWTKDTAPFEPVITCRSDYQLGSLQLIQAKIWNMKEKDHLEDLEVGGRIILKGTSILKQQNSKFWIHLVQDRVQRTRYWTLEVTLYCLIYVHWRFGGIYCLHLQCL